MTRVMTTYTESILAGLIGSLKERIGQIISFHAGNGDAPERLAKLSLLQLGLELLRLSERVFTLMEKKSEFNFKSQLLLLATKNRATIKQLMMFNPHMALSSCFLTSVTTEPKKAIIAPLLRVEETLLFFCEGKWVYAQKMLRKGGKEKIIIEKLDSTITNAPLLDALFKRLSSPLPVSSLTRSAFISADAMLLKYINYALNRVSFHDILSDVYTDKMSYDLAIAVVQILEEMQSYSNVLDIFSFFDPDLLAPIMDFEMSLFGDAFKFSIPEQLRIRYGICHFRRPTHTSTGERLGNAIFYYEFDKKRDDFSLQTMFLDNTFLLNYLNKGLMELSHNASAYLLWQPEHEWDAAPRTVKQCIQDIVLYGEETISVPIIPSTADIDMRLKFLFQERSRVFAMMNSGEERMARLRLSAVQLEQGASAGWPKIIQKLYDKQQLLYQRNEQLKIDLVHAFRLQEAQEQALEELNSNAIVPLEPVSPVSSLSMLQSKEIKLNRDEKKQDAMLGLMVMERDARFRAVIRFPQPETAFFASHQAKNELNNYAEKHYFSLGEIAGETLSPRLNTSFALVRAANLTHQVLETAIVEQQIIHLDRCIKKCIQSVLSEEEWHSINKHKQLAHHCLVYMDRTQFLVQEINRKLTILKFYIAQHHCMWASQYLALYHRDGALYTQEQIAFFPAIQNLHEELRQAWRELSMHEGAQESAAYQRLFALKKQIEVDCIQIQQKIVEQLNTKMQRISAVIADMLALQDLNASSFCFIDQWVMNFYIRKKTLPFQLALLVEEQAALQQRSTLINKEGFFSTAFMAVVPTNKRLQEVEGRAYHVLLDALQKQWMHYFASHVFCFESPVPFFSRNKKSGTEKINFLMEQLKSCAPSNAIINTVKQCLCERTERSLRVIAYQTLINLMTFEDAVTQHPSSERRSIETILNTWAQGDIIQCAFAQRMQQRYRAIKAMDTYAAILVQEQDVKGAMVLRELKAMLLFDLDQFLLRYATRQLDEYAERRLEEKLNARLHTKDVEMSHDGNRWRAFVRIFVGIVTGAYIINKLLLGRATSSTFFGMARSAREKHIDAVEQALYSIHPRTQP